MIRWTTLFFRKRITYQTEHVGTTKIRRVIVHTVNNEFENILNQIVVTYLKALCRHYSKKLRKITIKPVRPVGVRAETQSKDPWNLSLKRYCLNQLVLKLSSYAVYWNFKLSYLREGGITEPSVIKPRNKCKDAIQSEKLAADKRSILAVNIISQKQ